MPDAKPDRPEPLGLLVGALRRRIKQAVDVRARRNRLSPQQFWLLVAILEVEGCSLRFLAERQRIDAPTASRVVGGLKRRGLVRFEIDPTDRRRGCLRLTPKGRALAQKMRSDAIEIREAVAAGLSDAEQDRARVLLRHMLANLERFDPRP